MDGFGEETNPFREDAASVDGTSISDLNTGFGGTEAAESRPLPDSSATLHQSPEPSANRGVEPPPTSKTQAFLHSGGDVEILVSRVAAYYSLLVAHCALVRLQMHRRRQRTHHHLISSISFALE